jgi:predicted methyltransferase
MGPEATRIRTVLMLALAIASQPILAAAAARPDKALAAASAGDWRPPQQTARDQYRHPLESLTFWGLKPSMTILEVQPGAAPAWWTEILAP